MRNLNPGSKFIIAVPVCETLDETWRTLDSYFELNPGGFMLGVGGRLPALAPPGQPERVNFESLQRFIEELKSRYPDGFVAVDAEGGHIFNVLQDKSPLESPHAYQGFLDNPALSEKLWLDIKAHARLLAEADIDMNFAPLLDVPQPNYQGYAAEDSRCVSDQLDEIIEFGRQFMVAHQNSGIICTAKHFPGYGHLTENPHSVLSNQAQKWQADVALEPYRKLIDEERLQAVMLGHSTTPLHPDVPATLAQEAVSLLRNDLNFTGLTVADELFMGAVNDYYRTQASGRTDGDPLGEQRAIDAWRLCDLIIVSYPIQNRDGTVSGIPGGERRLGRMTRAVKEAMDRQEFSRESIDSSMQRLINAGLLKP